MWFFKNLLQFTFEKIACCAKKEKIITCREEKSQPPWISNGPSLITIKVSNHQSCVGYLKSIINDKMVVHHYTQYGTEGIVEFNVIIIILYIAR